MAYLAMVVLSLLFLRTRSVLYKSVVPLPHLGLQLSTTRGLSLPHPGRPLSGYRRWLVPLSTSHTFIPLSDISTVIVNEGLRRWNVRYYLAVVKRRGGGVVVALDEIWAPVAVLREVYHGVRESLFDEYADPP
ncbi:uncharacterized protein MKK02DRAFT_45598 [Dioszegia hungarica]|uniref:Phosphatidylinositol N-acetylglucosaminyltransferase subunit H conserved domain-containing protein n=1 Tax=Dioszegia hungarica TaxID=4972 RepID=A0AA38HCB4_9TREE|nr:uncharacterized protein MKK02DRAFT_45598 [Dioszegia hungarica]KAI9636889.1 hypothetical protein MKK02DRAFT_45598 [Dioszegia hungarica]